MYKNLAEGVLLYWHLIFGRRDRENLWGRYAENEGLNIVGVNTLENKVMFYLHKSNYDKKSIVLIDKEDGIWS